MTQGFDYTPHLSPPSLLSRAGIRKPMAFATGKVFLHFRLGLNAHGLKAKWQKRPNSQQAAQRQRRKPTTC